MRVASSCSLIFASALILSFSACQRWVSSDDCCSRLASSSSSFFSRSFDAAYVAFTSEPWVAKAQAAGRHVRYWQVRNAQHFDAFLALPDYRARYVPLLPYVYAALDRVMAHLDDPAQPLPAGAVIQTAPGAGALTAGQLAIPR